jgi:cytoskeletal protein CcmA (bactofilin family)
VKPKLLSKSLLLHLFALGALTVLLAVAASGPIAAKSTTWTGGSVSTDDWSDPGNWDNGVPEDFDDVYFSVVGGTSTMDIPGLALGELDMTGFTGVLELAEPLMVDADLTTSGTFDVAYNDLLVGGSIAVNGIISAPHGTISVAGGVSISGEFNCAPAGAVEVGGSITGSPSAALIMGSGSLVVWGNMLLSDFSEVSWGPGGILICSGSGLQRIALGSSGVTLTNITVSRAAASNVTQFELAGGLTIDGLVDVTRGTLKFVDVGTTLARGSLKFPDVDVVINGDVGIDVNGKITGDYQACNLDFRRTLTVSGEFSFAKPAGVLRLAAGMAGRISVTGTFIVAGDPTNRAHLEQDGVAGGTQWILEYNAAENITIDGVEVQDSDAQGSTPVVATNSADKGNNTNWSFVGNTTKKWIGTSAGGDNWSDPLNWDVGCPQAGDRVTFDAVAGASDMDMPGLALADMDMTGFSGTLTLMHPLTLTGGVTTSGTLALEGNYLALGGDLVVNGTVDASASDIAVGGDLEISGELDCPGGTIIVQGSITGSPGAILNMGSAAMLVEGDALLSDFAVVMWGPGGLLTCSGGSPLQTIAFGPAGVTLNDVTVSRSTTDARTRLEAPGSTVNIAGDLDVVQGVLELAGGDVTVSGDVDIPVNGKVEGKLDAGNVEFEGSVTVRGTFRYTKPAVRMRFGPGSTGAVNVTNGGTFEVVGAPPDRIRVEQDGVLGGERWLLVRDVTSNITVDGVEMVDGDVQGGPLTAATNSIDLGNNINWYFGPVSGGDAPPLRLAIQAAPNPFNPATTIRYALPHAGVAAICIYDASGRLVRELVSEFHAAGNYQTTWDGRNGAGRRVGSGAYFCRLESGGESAVRKIILLQ